MPYILYDYVNAHSENEFKKWTQSLELPQKAKLNAKLDMLAAHGAELFPELLTGTNTPGILKLRVHGNVQLRPLLCSGPVNIDQEFTLLLGAKEVGGKLVPKDADRKADNNKTEVGRNPSERRVRHERVN